MSQTQNLLRLLVQTTSRLNCFRRMEETFVMLRYPIVRIALALAGVACLGLATIVVVQWDDSVVEACDGFYRSCVRMQLIEPDFCWKEPARCRELQ